MENHNTHIVSEQSKEEHGYKYDNYGNVIVDSIDDLIYDKFVDVRQKPKESETKEFINNIIKKDEFPPVTPKKEEKKENDEINISNKKLGLETHYNKSEEGKIYKYNIIYLLDGLIIYKCSDNECNGNGIFDLNTKKFKIQEKHDKRYEEHEYIKNGESDNDIVYKELISNNKYIDAQILFDDKTKIVRFYC